MSALNDSTDSAGLLYDGGKRCTIFIIDFGEQMFRNESEECLKFALKSVRNRVNYLCCTGGLNELVAIIFINTLNTNKDAENIDCVFVHRPIGNLDAEYVKQLDSLINSNNIRKTLAQTLGEESGTCNWGEVLFLCQRMLTYSGSVLRRREIQIYTVDHDPIMADDSILRKVRSYVADLKSKCTQLNVCLTDIALKHQDNENLDEINEEESSNIDSFWAEIDLNALQNSTLSQFRNEILRKDIALRTTTSVPLKLGFGVQFAVGVYCLIKEQSKPTHIPLDAKTNECLEYRSHYVSTDKNEKKPNVKVDSNFINNENSENNVKNEEEECFEGEVNFARQIGGVNVVLNRTEVEGLRRFDDPGITIIGFKPIQCLKYSHRMGLSKFVLPLDSEINGSATLYKALYRKCLERQLFILVRYTEKTNTTPKLAALIPQEQSTEQKYVNDTYRYEGFHLIELPFAEDKRNLDEKLAPPNDLEKWPAPAPSQIEAAKAFVKRLTTKYAPHQFTNPVLQRFYAGLEAVALDLDIGDTDDNSIKNKFDKIRPYYENELLSKRVQPQLEALKQVLPSYLTTEEAPKKRTRGTNQNNETNEETLAPKKKESSY